MKCEFCSGDLSIEDVRCPHCDADNPYYKAHRADMADFKKRYKDTENRVVERNKRFSRTALNITIIAVLVALIAICIVVLANMYEIKYQIKQNRDTKNAASIAKTLGELEEAEDYIGLSDYYNLQYIKQSYKTEVYEYLEVASVANSYSGIYNQIVRIVYPGRTYETPSSVAQTLSRNLMTMYEEVYGSRYESHKDAVYYAPKHMEAMLDMVEKSHLLLKTYAGVTDEDIASMKDMTHAQIELLLEERLKEVMANE